MLSRFGVMVWIPIGATNQIASVFIIDTKTRYLVRSGGLVPDRGYWVRSVIHRLLLSSPIANISLFPTGQILMFPVSDMCISER